MQFPSRTELSFVLNSCSTVFQAATVLDYGVCCAVKLTVEKGEGYLVWNVVLREFLEDPLVDVGVVEGLQHPCSQHTQSGTTPTHRPPPHNTSTARLQIKQTKTHNKKDAPTVFTRECTCFLVYTAQKSVHSGVIVDLPPLLAVAT